MAEIDAALGLFEAEMKALGLWDAVTLVTVSDFGRTLTFNGLGTDHAWGGNYFIAGGNVSGSQIHGKYPDRLIEEKSDFNIGRGRILPTLAWESMWEGLAQWMGVSESDMPTVLPNLKNFPPSHRLDLNELFDVDLSTIRSRNDLTTPSQDSGTTQTKSGDIKATTPADTISTTKPLIMSYSNRINISSTTLICFLIANIFAIIIFPTQ